MQCRSRLLVGQRVFTSDVGRGGSVQAGAFGSVKAGGSVGPGGILKYSPADYVRRPTVSPLSPTLGLTHLQFEAIWTAARDSSNPSDFALVCLLGLLGLRIFEATSLDISDLSEEHRHRVLRVVGKGPKIVLVPLPPAVARAVDRSIAEREEGPILLNRNGDRLTRQSATRSLHRLQRTSGVSIARMHPHILSPYLRDHDA